MTPDVGCVLLTGNGPSPRTAAGRSAPAATSASGAATATATPRATTRRAIDPARSRPAAHPRGAAADPLHAQGGDRVVPGWAAGGGHSLHVVCDLTLASTRARPLQADRRRRGQLRRRLRLGVPRPPGRPEVRPRDLLPRPATTPPRTPTGWAWSTPSCRTPSSRRPRSTGRGEINGKSPTAQRMLKFAFNLIDDGLVGQQVFAGEATRLAYMTDEAAEGRDSFLEKRDARLVAASPGTTDLGWSAFAGRPGENGTHWSGSQPTTGGSTEMSDLIVRLTDVVGDAHVLTGDAIPDDYTHDEALTASRCGPLAVVRPGTDGRGRRASLRAWPTSTACPVTARGTRHRAVGRVHPRGRRHRRVVRAHERDPRDRHRQPRRGRAARRHARPARRGDRAPHGLVYPVFPGEYSASLGGNVATNAGGMRAVKYGVTRHQVLGLEAVLATGEVIRTGGKFVKATTGYDLTQLIIGSEGTLALVTEATLQALPAARARGHRAGAVRHARRGHRRGARRSSRSGVGPLILEYIDLHHDGRDHARTSASSSASRRSQGRRARLPRGRARETATTTGSTRTPSELAELLADLGALDVYVLPPARGAPAHRSAREGVLGREGRRRRRHHRHGRAPRRRSPSTWPRSPSSPPSTGSLDRRLRPRRRRQRAPVGVPGATRTCAHDVMHDIFAAGHGARRRDLGRARHRHREEGVLPRARGPGQARADAPHQGRVRPARHPQPRHDLRLIDDEDRP